MHRKVCGAKFPEKIGKIEQGRPLRGQNKKSEIELGRPEKFGKTWYRFEENRSKNEGGVCEHTYIHTYGHTDGSYLYKR